VRNQWVKNCVAIGLAGGFIEPLESTAIHMVDHAARWLAENLPGKDMSPPLRDRYNRQMGKVYDEVLDFICLHYRLGNRTDDQYWIDARTEMKIPDRLAENLEVWKHRLPQVSDVEFATLFDYKTYQAVWLGKQVYKNGFGKGSIENVRPLRKPIWFQFQKAAKQELAQIVRAMPDHKTLLREIRGEAKPTTAFAAMASPATVQLPGTVPMVASVQNMPDMAEIESGQKDLQLF
jgi:tryptophan halogenase